MSYPANQAYFSSGQLVFADPSQAWDPSQFPTLPSTMVTLTAQGTAAAGNLSTLTLTNSTIYEVFEPTAVHSSLTKQAQVSRSGLITYRETRMGFVSTLAPAFGAAVSSFQPSTFGGAGLLDALSGAPDTVTNGLAKLDAWIANAFLFQPPTITPTGTLPNSMFGSLQWTNFIVYPILDKFVPYVTSIVLIIGDPTTANYCTLEITNDIYFPYKNFQDGISPYKTPLVALRLFTDFFPATAPISLNRLQLTANCFRVISEFGNATFPETGRVLQINPTDAASTYTTMSLYLPNLAASYPKGTPIPVSVVYLNNTDNYANVAQLSTLQTTTGGPSVPNGVTVQAVAPQIVQLEVLRPDYSDQIAQFSTPYFSTYITQYTAKQMATANTVGEGFMFGLPNPTITPSTLSSYVGSTFQQSFCYNSSVQVVDLTGTVERPLLPGVSFSTGTYAVNQGYIVGDIHAGPTVATAFPEDPAPSLSTINIVVGDPTQARHPSTLFNLANGAQGWSLGTVVPDAVLFLSTVAPFAFQVSTATQFNDETYPGDQTGVEITTALQDQAGNDTFPVINTISAVNYDYTLGTPYSTVTNGNTLAATVRDTQTTFGYTKFFYKADISGAVNVSTISTNPFHLEVVLSNNVIADSNTAAVSQLINTPVFRFQTEPANHVSTASLQVTDVTQTIRISGIYTPQPSSIITYDMSGTNFAHWYATSSLAKAYLAYDGVAVTPVQQYSTNVRLLNNGTPVTTLPIPQNTVLMLSSLGVRVGNGMYTDPNDPRDYALIAGVTPASPIPYPYALKSTLLSSLYVDTYSYYTYTNFMSTLGPSGQRIVTMMPNVDNPGSSNNIIDGVTSAGDFGVGLDVDISSFVVVTLPATVSLQSSLMYNHASSLAAAYPDFYSRELLFTSNTFIHPAGYNFAQFNGGSNTYPNFTYDLENDVNFGYRYATFAFEWEPQNPPALYGYININVHAPSLVSTITSDRTQNNWWPDTTVSPNLTSSMKVRMHAKLVGTYELGTYETFETSWLNCMKQLNFYSFDDSVFDTGAAIDVIPGASNVVYKAQISRRLYTKVAAFVRIGISQDGSQYSGDPITFTGLDVHLTNS